ncbi:MAG: carboxypeptidase-like regulatory domain-containing protein, partial [Actinobacteria bacterium]|nr:carboxypeptidase-like regulatory domain-containing protein [Actinomycetota bacterium]
MKLSPAQSLAFLLFLTPSAHAQEAERDLPWKAFGKVTDPEGRPLAGVDVWASCGMGTLRRTGSATSGEGGRYELNFGPGILVLRDRGAVLHATVVGAHKPGYFEENLNRQGGCTGADGEPTEEQLKTWDAKKDRVFLPGKPLEINFVMRPAGRVSGKLVDEQGKPLPGYSVSLTGAALAPASSVWASCKADEQGRFTLEDIPTTYRFQFEVRMARVKPPWD